MRMKPFVAIGFATCLLAMPAVGFSQDATPKAPAQVTPASHVEQRIKRLHNQLKITAAQETQWAAVAQVMRDNAQAVGSLATERRQKASSMNAVDDLRAYQKIADAHAAGLDKLVPAFEALYAAMSPDQQKNADAIFAKAKRKPAAKK